MSDSITATAGFFWNNAVSPDTATDLITAVEDAESNVNNALTSEINAAASATAAAASALSAAGAQSAAATSETNAATSASTATTQAAAAASSATAAASSASSAAADVTSAASSASAAAGSATTAASSATAAANSATNAATSATAAAASATTASNAAATIPAPSVGTATNYIRVNSSGNAYEKRTVAQVATDVGVLNDVGRNLLHNGLFRIRQRGSGPFTADAAYTADRWVIAKSTDSVSWVPVTLTDGDRTQIGDEEAITAFQNTFTGDSGASSFNEFVQKIEGVRRLAGKTVTVSFYALATSGTPKVGINIQQVFGTGGSPSTAVFALSTGNSVTLSTTWRRYSTTIAIPSASGKTLGSNGDDCTRLVLAFSSGSTNNAALGNIGVQTNVIALWGVQLEIGTTMTPLEKPDIAVDFAKCQRFYQVGSVQMSAYSSTGGAISYLFPWAVPMRAPPTVNFSGAAFTNASGLTSSSSGANGMIPTATVTTTGAAVFSGGFTSSADL